PHPPAPLHTLHHPHPTPLPYTTLFRSAREVVQKSLLRQLAPIVVEDNAGCGRGRRIVLCQHRIVLAGIGCPRSDVDEGGDLRVEDRKSTRLNSSHRTIWYGGYCL